MKRLTETPRVRICAYPADWLLEDAFANSTKIIWSTGQKTKRGDIQVFAVSSTLKNAPELKHDARRNAVHSIWRAVSPPKDEYWQEQYPVQADFRLLVKLKNPVPKAELIRARLLNGQWPHHWQGKVLHSRTDVEKLAEVLAKWNPKQRKAIFNALEL